jgi:ABC-type sugar transport system ATPase subunit
MATPLVRMAGISKRFGRVPVLRGVDLDVWPGEVHILAGENGAGKSTLIKILAGVYQDFEGAIEIGGKAVRPASPLDSRALGVAVIHQELSLVPSMSVADNMFLGRPIASRGLVNDRAQQLRAREILAPLGLELDVRRPVEDFPIATQQIIEIARALGQQAQVLVMDEPTSALSAPEVETLFGLIEGIRQRACGVLYITHKMEEIERIADRITVLRDGACVGSVPAAELPTARLVSWMVGRQVPQQQARPPAAVGAERLRLANFRVALAGKTVVDDVSLAAGAGEILGIMGLRGSGVSDLLLGIFGAHGQRAQGDLLVDGKPVRIRTPRDAIGHGIAMVTNDRKANGLVLSASITANITLADLGRVAKNGWIRPAREKALAARLAGAIDLRASSLDMEAGQLSGGNQQKVVLAKWMQTEPKVLLLDEPTRGIDIGAKQDIYRLMREWAASGTAILLITTEMPELLALSDRIVVLYRGRIAGEFAGPRASAKNVLEAAMGMEMQGAHDSDRG